MSKLRMTKADFKKHGYYSKINGIEYVLTMNKEGATVLMPFKMYKKNQA